MIISDIDKRISVYVKDIQESILNHDIIQYQMNKIRCSQKVDTIYESCLLENILEQSVCQYNESFDYRSHLPYIVPYLSFDEYSEYNKDNINIFEYLYTNQKSYFNTIRELQHDLKLSGNKDIENKLLEMGWNPYVPINGNTIKFARDKQINYLNKYKKMNLYNISKFETNLPDNEIDVDVLEESTTNPKRLLEPVYIVLSYTNTLFGKVISKYKHNNYTHAGLSLDESLTNIYSYNLHRSSNINGFTIKSLDDYNNEEGDADLKILCLFVTYEVKEKIRKILNWFEQHIQQSRYSIKNIFNIVINKSNDNIYNLQMVCSQFVDSILKMCNIDITKMSSNLVDPGTFEKINKIETDNVSVYNIYTGKKSNYISKEIKNKVNALLRMRYRNYNKLVSQSEAINMLFDYKIENLDIYCEDSIFNSYILELRNMIIPTCSIHEVKFPIGFNKKGDLYIIKPKDLQIEYNECHKLLSMYDQTNSSGIKHELARLFYLNYIIEKKIKRLKNKNFEYKELIDLRARILNDFTTYFKLIKTIEPEFDFSDYIKHSEYYNKNILIDKNTLKYSGNIIKKIISGAN